MLTSWTDGPRSSWPIRNEPAAPIRRGGPGALLRCGRAGQLPGCKVSSFSSSTAPSACLTTPLPWPVWDCTWFWRWGAGRPPVPGPGRPAPRLLPLRLACARSQPPPSRLHPSPACPGQCPAGISPESGGAGHHRPAHVPFDASASPLRRERGGVRGGQAVRPVRDGPASRPAGPADLCTGAQTACAEFFRVFPIFSEKAVDILKIR